MAPPVPATLRDRYRRLSLRTKFALHITLSTVLLFAALQWRNARSGASSWF